MIRALSLSIRSCSIRAFAVLLVLGLGCARQAQPCEQTTAVSVANVESTDAVVSHAYASGDRVWIRFGEAWYPGRVAEELAPGVYEVGYEGYDAEWNRVARAPQLRAYDDPPPSELLSDAPPNAAPQAGHPVNDVMQLQSGDHVLVLWNERWWPAEVRSVREGEAEIRYDGYDASFDEWVGADRLSVPRE